MAVAKKAELESWLVCRLFIAISGEFQDACFFFLFGTKFYRFVKALIDILIGVCVDISDGSD